MDYNNSLSQINIFLPFVKTSLKICTRANKMRQETTLGMQIIGCESGLHEENFYSFSREDLLPFPLIVPNHQVHSSDHHLHFPTHMSL